MGSEMKGVRPRDRFRAKTTWTEVVETRVVSGESELGIVSIHKDTDGVSNVFWHQLTRVVLDKVPLNELLLLLLLLYGYDMTANA